MKKTLKALVAAAIIGGCLALALTQTGCISAGSGGSRIYAGLTTGGVVYATRTISATTNGGFQTNSFKFKLNLGINPLAIVQILAAGEGF